MATKTAPKLESSSVPEPPPGAENPAPGPEQTGEQVPVLTSVGAIAGPAAPAPGPPVAIAGSAHSAEIGALMQALAKAQASLKGALKDAKNPHLRNTYADLSSVWTAWQEVGPVCGLALVQLTQADERSVTVVSQLGHSSGQWIRSSLTLPWELQKGITPAQAIGSALTYARRYALAALVGVCPEDDDGNAAGRPAEVQARGNGNGNGKHPAAERREAKMATSSGHPDSTRLKGEVWSLVLQYCGVQAEDGSWDNAATKVEAAVRLLAANEEGNPPRVAVDADGMADLSACSPAQLASLKGWLSTAILNTEQKESDPF